MNYDAILWLMFLCVSAGFGIGSGIIMLGTEYTLANRISTFGVLNTIIGAALLYAAWSFACSVVP